MPSFEVQRCTEADIPRVFEIVSLAFANDHEYVDAVFPAHNTPAGRKAGSERMLQLFHGDPYGNFVKCVDIETGTIAAAAKWNFYNGGEVPAQPAIDGDYWVNEEEKEFAQCIFHSFFAPRQCVIEETSAHLAGITPFLFLCDILLTHTALDMMMVDPAYQRMGAGRLLVKWGLAEAEKMGVDVSI
jgi:GNAT superfamily N-acetyltransferase